MTTKKEQQPKDEGNKPPTKPKKTAKQEATRDLEAKLTEYEDLIKRQQSEFENYRKRTLKEKEETIKYGTANMFERLLPVIDDFERALTVDKKEETNLNNYLEGFEMIYKKLQSFLQEHGVVSVGEVGEVFDPAKHRSIQFEEGNATEDAEDDTLSEIYQKGYLLGERLLRPATVKVRKKATPNENELQENTNETQ